MAREGLRRSAAIAIVAVASIVVVAVVLWVTRDGGGGSASADEARDGSREPLTESTATGAAVPLPDSAYYMEPDLEPWVDPETGWDTKRTWSLDGGEWPVMIVMSPSQSPQLLLGTEAGLFERALKPFGITPVVQKLDGPERVFHALERSQWPFVYMPLAVFMDYSRTEQNQGSAGGLQYVVLAGSTAGGGYTLVAKDPAIKTVADLRGKKVTQINSNPVPGTLFKAAVEKAGMTLGDGPDQVSFHSGPGGDQLNAYEAGEFDAAISLNILKKQFLDMGSHAVTDFSDLDYTPNYTILCVERSVLEERPDVVKAFLEAHYEADKLAEERWDEDAKAVLMSSWNSFFQAEDTPRAAQRIVPDQATFDAMLGNMWPEDRLDRELIEDCFAFNELYGLWGWDGSVDTARLVDYRPYNEVLSANGDEPQ